MKGLIFGFLRGLKFPIKLLMGLFKKRRKTSERERKMRGYVRNFTPRNISWGRGKRKKGKFSRKKTNNLKVSF
jgi:hypothetical protein